MFGVVLTLVARLVQKIRFSFWKFPYLCPIRPFVHIVANLAVYFDLLYETGNAGIFALFDQRFYPFKFTGTAARA
jgi:hypothetical protein